MATFDPPLRCHDLVALMHVAIGTGDLHASHQNSIPLHHLSGGILDSEEGNERTLPILDALASICISEPIRQVVAVGLQWDQHESRICLTIAENGPVKRDLVSYLTKVWDTLRKLSIQFSSARCLPYKTTPPIPQRKVSPMMPAGVGRDIRISLFRHIYLYTRAKNQQRVAKWLPGLEEFMKVFYKLRGRVLIGFDHDLHVAFRALKCAYCKLERNCIMNQLQKDWEILYSMFEVGTCRVTKITGQNVNFCHDIAHEVQVGK